MSLIDLYERIISSWRIGNNMTTTLVTDTIRNMPAKQKATVGLVLHKAAAADMHFYHFERINIENGLTPDDIRSKAAWFHVILR